MSDIIEKFSSHLKSVLTRALCFAVETQEQVIQPEHLLWSIGTEKGSIAAELLKKAGLKPTELRKLVGATATTDTTTMPPDSMTLHLSDHAKRMVEKAVLTANMYGHKYIGTEHLLAGILQIETEKLGTFFEQQKTDLKHLRQQITIVLKNTAKFPDVMEGAKKDGLLGTTDKKTNNTESSETEKMPALKYFARELTSPEIQKKIDPVIGRESEIERMMEILCRRTKNNPLLLGEPGVGKTAVVEGLAKKIMEGRVPHILQHKRVFALDLTMIVAGTMYRGEFEGRLRQIIDEAEKAEDVVLFIDEIHTIVGAGAAAGSMDAANILKPALARGDLHCIGATTPAEYKKYIESDSALERRFQTVRVEEPDEQKAIEILQGIAPHYEAFHRVRISPEAIERAVKLSSRYIQDRNLPDKAIDLLDEASAAVRIRSFEPGPVEKKKMTERKLDEIRAEKRQAVIEERFLDALHLKETEDLLRQNMTAENGEVLPETNLVISGDDIAGVISRMLNIPLHDLLLKDQEKLSDLETELARHVLGQEEVIKTVSGALRRAKTGVAHPKRPLASLLFLGPSGVGKTELAKAITETFFHNPKHLIRLDMSEYSEGFTMSKLIGAPAGYIGYKETANLTDRVRQKPYSVVLFDEIEKAHRDVQNLLLQILEEGEIMDASGKLVNFKNTIVILTSNVGLEQFESNGLGFSSGVEETKIRMTADVRKELEERFRPELLNRLDHTCLFEPLNITVLESICKKQLDELCIRLKEQGLTLTIHESVVKFILSNLDIKSGARSIRHRIQTHVEHPLAERLVKKDRPRALEILVQGKKITVRNRR